MGGTVTHREFGGVGAMQFFRLARIFTDISETTVRRFGPKVNEMWRS
jgi:hypothetical protein